jgi:threonine synthase
MNDEWNKKQAGQEVETWLKQLKSKGGFGVHADIPTFAKKDFKSERISDEQTIKTTKQFHATLTMNGNGNGKANGIVHKGGYILDPHSAIGVAASLRSIKRASLSETHHISLATTHPTKFTNAVDLALKNQQGFSFDTVLPEEFIGLEKKEQRVRVVPKGASWEGVRSIVEEEVDAELKGSR